jgi:hypothetical protein
MCSPSSGAARKRGVALTLSANSFDRQGEVDQTAIGCPVSPSAPGSFGKSQSGTHFGKMAPSLPSSAPSRRQPSHATFPIGNRRRADSIIAEPIIRVRRVRMTNTYMALALSLAGQSLGYPVYVHVEEGVCHFQIQDMVMSKEREVRDWLRELPDKQRKIDLVSDDKRAASCVRKAEAIVRRSGFFHIAVRRGTMNDYPDGLRPGK